MTIEEAKQTMYALASTHYGKEFYEKENEAIKIACKSLEAWEKVEADILGLDGYYDDAFWEGTYAVSKIIGKRLAEVTK